GESQRCDGSDLPDSHEPPTQALISIPGKSKLRSVRRFFSRVRKNIFLSTKAPNSYSGAQPILIQVPCDPQPFESQVRMNRRDLRQLAGNKARITTSRNDGNFLARKLLCSDSRQNLPNQSTVAEDGTGTHCLNSRFTDCTVWFFQRHPREQRCPLVKKICHRFESWCNHAADVAAPLRNHIKSHCCAEVHDDRRRSVKFDNSRGVRQTIRSDRLGFGIINRDTQLQFPIQPENLRFLMGSLRDRRVFCRHH